MTINVEQNVRNQLGRTPREIQTDFMDRTNILDGQLGYLYSGKVVNNKDSDKEGKCQIRVYGVFGEEIPDSDLPWALPDNSFVGSKIGSFIVPPVDAIVKVYFDRGDIYLPHYTTKAVDLRNQSTQKDIDYPDNMVMYETCDGDYLTINRKTKETTFNHNSGVKITIDKNGVVEMTGTQGSNSLMMDRTGVKVNDKFLVTEDFLQDMLITFASNLGLGNFGTPVPIFPATLTGMIQKFNVLPDKYLTNKIVG